MTIGQFVMTYHTQVSLVFGPILIFVLLRWSPLPRWANLLIAFGILLVALGMLGVIYNLWAFAIALVWTATKGRGGRRFLYYVALGLGVLLILAAIAFYVFVFVTNPKEFFANWWNPLSYIYLVPGILLLTVADHFRDEPEPPAPQATQA